MPTLPMTSTCIKKINKVLKKMLLLKTESIRNSGSIEFGEEKTHWVFGWKKITGEERD